MDFSTSSSFPIATEKPLTLSILLSIETTCVSPSTIKLNIFDLSPRIDRVNTLKLGVGSPLLNLVRMRVQLMKVVGPSLLDQCFNTLAFEDIQ